MWGKIKRINNKHLLPNVSLQFLVEKIAYHGQSQQR